MNHLLNLSYGFGAGFLAMLARRPYREELAIFSVAGASIGWIAKKYDKP